MSSEANSSHLVPVQQTDALIEKYKSRGRQVVMVNDTVMCVQSSSGKIDNKQIDIMMKERAHHEKTNQTRNRLTLKLQQRKLNLTQGGV